MAVNIGSSIFVRTYDKSYKVRRDELESFMFNIIEQWEWVKDVDDPSAMEFYHEMWAQASSVKDQDPDSGLRKYNLTKLVAPVGELGKFVLSTKKEHGDLTAYYALELGISRNRDTKYSVNIDSDVLRKNTTYEYRLAQFLFFQYLGAGDYIANNTAKKFEETLSEFKDSAKFSLDSISATVAEVENVRSDLAAQQRRFTLKSKRVEARRIRRYQRVFKEVQAEALATKVSAAVDLKAAYDTYHAQVDLKSSVVYWAEKVIKHEKSKKLWLCGAVLMIAFTFAAPVVYYVLGGVSALTARHHAELQNTAKVAKGGDVVGPSSAPIPGTTNPASSVEKNTTLSSVETIAVASGIADLTGAALLVALLSVLLRLSLRQYNVAMYLAHDAEERITMLKTYLALSNEGKLTADGDMKLVLETLFRASQTSAVPDSSPSTPIELIIKAITERGK